MAFHSLFIVALFLLSLSHFMPVVIGHARLIYPPSRASMWRLGFPKSKKTDYNDNEGFCGGAFVLHQQFNSKCGVCGDPWSPRPREHERGGDYYTGQETATLKAGDVITAEVQVTANHKGFFEFRVCPYDNPEAGDLEMDENGKMVEVTQSCLDKHILRVENGQGTKYYLNSGRIGFVKANLTLPVDLHCKKCLFQWRYKTGNSWGTDKSGKGCIGCGNQEEFKACADVIIEPFAGETTMMTVTTTQEDRTSDKDSSENKTETFSGNTMTMATTQKDVTSDKDFKTDSSENKTETFSGNTMTMATTQIDVHSDKDFKTDSSENKTVTTLASPTYQTTTSHDSQSTAAETRKCWPTLIYAKVPGMTTWCNMNCNMGYCPSSHCLCNTS